jgi:hypothetical protein
MFRRHPWLAPTLSLTRPQAVASAMPYSEWMLAGLTDQGLDLTTAFTAHLTLFNHIRATAVHIESELEAEARSGMDNEQWMHGQEQQLLAILAGGEFPLMVELTTGDYDFDLDALFEFGLQRMLDGIELLARRKN